MTTLDKNVKEGFKKDNKKKTSFTILLDKSAYAFGDKVTMSVDCDNQQTKIGIKEFVFNLFLNYVQTKDGKQINQG